MGGKETLQKDDLLSGRTQQGKPDLFFSSKRVWCHNFVIMQQNIAHDVILEGSIEPCSAASELVVVVDFYFTSPIAQA